MTHFQVQRHFFDTNPLHRPTWLRKSAHFISAQTIKAGALSFVLYSSSIQSTKLTATTSSIGCTHIPRTRIV